MSLLTVLNPSLAGVRALLNIDAFSAIIPVTFTTGSRGNLMGRLNCSKLALEDKVLRNFSIFAKLITIKVIVMLYLIPSNLLWPVVFGGEDV